MYGVLNNVYRWTYKPLHEFTKYLFINNFQIFIFYKYRNKKIKNMKGTIKFLMTFKKSSDLEHLKNAIKGVTFDQFLQSFQTKATVE